MIVVVNLVILIGKEERMSEGIPIHRTQSWLGILGDGLGALRDGVPGEFTGEDELDSGLDLSGRESPPLVEANELGSLGANAVEGVMDERVHDVHGLLADSDVGVHLLEDLVDVD